MTLSAAPPPTDLGIWLLVVGIWVLILVAGGVWADRIDRANPRDLP